MRRLNVLSAMLVAGFTLCCAGPVDAQGVASGYRPATPTISPWLDLYQRQGAGGPLDPYHQFVRPELNLQQTLRQQSLTNQRQGAQVSTLGQQMTQMEQDRLAPIRPTGTGSVYMSYSHYYPMQGAAGRGSHAPAQARRASSPRPAGSAQSMGSAGRGF